MKIAHISDTHICLPQPPNSHRLADLEMAVDEIIALRHLPDIVIHTGDIAHNGQSTEYRAAQDLLSKLPMPLFAIPGNKDDRTTMRAIFPDAIPIAPTKTYFQYRLDEDETALIFLDTLDEGERWGTLCEKRLNDFSQMLSVQPEKPVAIFMHHPPFDVVEAPRPFQFANRQIVDAFEKIVRDNSQITGIYCGHSHRYGSAMIGTPPVSAIPSIAIDLRWGEYDETQRQRPVYEVYDL